MGRNSERWRCVPVAVAILALVPFFATPAFGQTWNGSTNNNWFAGTNWLLGTAPNSSSAVVTIENGTNNPVMLNAPASISTLTLGSSNSLDVTAGLWSIFGASISNAGSITLDSQLQLNNTLTLLGAGKLTLAGGEIGASSSGQTLINQSTIQGSGLIGSNNGALYQNLSLNNSGTIDANSSGNTLTIGGTGTAITNTGLFEASNSGTLDLTTSSAIDDKSGKIAASGSGSTVNVSTTIQGGQLTTLNGGVMETVGTATLDGSTQGAITLTGGSTYTAGTGTVTGITGTLNLGVATGSTLALSGQLQLTGNTTLSGPGALILSSSSSNSGQIGTNNGAYTLTNQSIIEGSGLIGSNASSVYPNLSLINSGTIDANSSGNNLTIGGSGASIANTGLFEATNGGILDLATQGPIDNTGATITANGSGSTVQVSTAIQGGTLNTLNGGVMETVGTAVLDGSTQGAITLSDGSTYTAGNGTVTKLTGALNLGTSTGSTLALSGQLQLTGNTTLSGPGALIMSSSGSNSGQIGTNSGAWTLTNQSIIEGSGLIGSNASSVYPNLSLINSGTIDANSSGNNLTIGGTGASITNTGLFEATNGGTLDLATQYPINNDGGAITANGSGSTVQVSTAIQGGTLTTLNSGVMETSGTATLDGFTQGAITLTDGSTYTAGNGTVTKITGALNLGTSTGSTLALSGQLQLTGNTTLSGPGALIMSSSNSNSGQIGTNSGAFTLTNESTIQGYGLIGSNASSVYPNLSLTNSGTVNANSSGNTLTIGGSGSTTNTGLFEATNGGALDLATQNAINNTGGTITATGSGSTVNVSTAIQGGTLTTLNGGVMQTVSAATLDGSTQGAITLSDGSTYTAGTAGLTKITGALNLGTTTGSTLAVSGQLQLTGTTTLSGPGSLTLTAGQIGANSYNGQTLINQSTIEGTGLIGSNIGALYDALSLSNSGTVNAVGGTLTIGGIGTTTNTATGTMQVQSGSTLEIATSFTNFSGNTLTGGNYYVGGTLQFGASGSQLDTNAANLTLAGPGAKLLDLGGNNLLSGFNTNAGGANFAVVAGGSFTTSGAFTNSGTMDLEQASSLTVSGNLTNSGTVVTNNQNLQGGANNLDVTGTLTNNSLASVTIGVNNDTSDVASAGLLANAGTVTVDKGATFNLTAAGTDTNSGSIALNGGTLNMQQGSFTNSGTMDLEQKGTLTVTGNLTNSGAITTNNANLQGGANTLTVTGTLTNNATDSVTIGVNNDTSDVASVGLLSNAGTVTVDKGAILNLTASGTDTNSGSIALNGGTLNTQAGSFTNSGSLDLERKGTLTVTGNLTNSGAITTNNANLQGGANILTVTGTLTNNTGNRVSIGANNDTSDQATVGALANSGTVTVGTGASLTLQSAATDTNAGSIAISGALNINAATTLSGTGALTLTSGAITGLGSGKTLNNNSTIQGSGTISNLGIANAGLLLANQAVALNILPSAAGLNNTGTIEVNAGSALNISGLLTNFNTATDTLTGGTYYVKGGTLRFTSANIVVNAADIILSGAASQILNLSGVNALANFATNAAGGAFTLGAGRSFTTGGNFTNNGTLVISSGDTFKVSGSLSNFANSILTGGTYDVGGTLQFGPSGSSLTTNAANLTLSGTGAKLLDLGGNNLLSGFNTNATGGTFTIAGAGSFTTGGAFSNSGTVDLEQASSLTVSGNFTNSGTLTTNNENLQGGANTLTVTGTLTNNALDTVTIGANNDTSDVASAGLLSNAGTVTVDKGATLKLTSAGTDTNSGAIALNGGKLTMLAGALTNSGTIDLEQQGALTAVGNLTNSGTITTNNANLQGAANTITVYGALTNDVGANVTIGANNDTSDKATVSVLANSGTVTVGTGASLTLQSTATDTNSGTIAVNGTLNINAAATLTGAGTLTLTNGAITGLAAGSALTNNSVIQGSGTISNLGIVNAGYLVANQATPLIVLPSSAGLNNTGSILVGAGDTMQIGTSAGNALLNLAAAASTPWTLTGGTYNLSGTLQFGAPGTTLQTNAASITLSGAGQMIDFGGHNILSGFNNNSAQGSFTLASNASLTTSGGSFVNAGSFTVNAGSTFTVGGSSFNYTQTGGATVVDGTLTSTSLGTVAVNGGSLRGYGTLGDNVVDAGALIPTGARFTVADTYTQSSAGVLDINALQCVNGGCQTGLDQLKVNQSATLGGTLNIDLANGTFSSFLPTVGQTFTILQASSLSGAFSTVNGLAINSNEHFTITYNDTAGTVVLTVVSGALAAPNTSTMLRQILRPVLQHGSGVSAYASRGLSRTAPSWLPVSLPVSSGRYVETGIRGARRINVQLPTLVLPAGMSRTAPVWLPVSLPMSSGEYVGTGMSGSRPISVQLPSLVPPPTQPISIAPPATGIGGLRPMDAFGSPVAPGISPVSGAARNGMPATNHLRFECGVDLKALLKTSRKQLLQGLWAAPDSPHALAVGYLSYQGNH
jgi:hypothetical protein